MKKNEKTIEVDIELLEYLTKEKLYREWIGTKWSPDNNDVKKLNISYSNLIREKFFLDPVYSGKRYAIKQKVKLVRIIENLLTIFKKMDQQHGGAPVWIKKMDIVFRSHYEEKEVDRGLDYLIRNGYVEEDKSAQQLVGSGLPQDVVDRVVSMVDRNEYKKVCYHSLPGRYCRSF